MASFTPQEKSSLMAFVAKSGKKRVTQHTLTTFDHEDNFTLFLLMPLRGVYSFAFNLGEGQLHYVCSRDFVWSFGFWVTALGLLPGFYQRQLNIQVKMSPKRSKLHFSQLLIWYYFSLYTNKNDNKLLLSTPCQSQSLNKESKPHQVSSSL